MTTLSIILTHDCGALIPNMQKHCADGKLPLIVTIVPPVSGAEYGSKEVTANPLTYR
jgi:hypothetical protein